MSTLVTNELEAARDRLHDASRMAEGRQRERLEDIADQIDGFVSDQRGPDVGRIMRLQQSLTEIAQSVDEEVEHPIAEAKSRLVDYAERPRN